MAAVTLTMHTPAQNTGESAANKRRRVVMPAGARWLTIYSASACYLEWVDAADAGDIGTAYLTIAAGATTTLPMRRGECAVSGSAGSQVIELLALP